MRKNRMSASLALVTLLAACGIGSDGKTDLRPAPPAPGFPETQLSDLPDDQNSATSAAWYEHYDLSEVVVTIDSGTLATPEAPTPRANTDKVTLRPTREAYAKRLENLQQARESLLRENAALAARLALQLKQPNKELGTLREQLGSLRKNQRLVMTRTQAIEVEHQELLSMLAQSVASIDLRTDE